jgi:hypothetical protein
MYGLGESSCNDSSSIGTLKPTVSKIIELPARSVTDAEAKGDSGPLVEGKVAA